MLLLLNGNPIQLGSPLPDPISSVKIMYAPGTMIPDQQVPLVKQWLNDLVDRLTCDHILINGTIISKNDITKFTL